MTCLRNVDDGCHPDQPTSKQFSIETIVAIMVIVAIMPIVAIMVEAMVTMVETMVQLRLTTTMMLEVTAKRCRVQQP